MLNRIILLLLISFPFSARAQLYADSKQVEGLVKVAHTNCTSFRKSSSTEMLNKLDVKMSNPVAQVNSPKSTSILYYTTKEIPTHQPRHYGVFCRIESKIEKKSKISPRFRLGSSAYVDMLEGKRIMN